MFDFAIIETENGGDLQTVGNDLATYEGIEGMPYLSWFGGNPGFPTGKRNEGEEAFDWWGNRLLLPDNQSIQFNSLLEMKLQTVALTSAGRADMEETAKKDLEWLLPYGTYEVTVTIVTVDHIRLRLFVKMKDGTTYLKIVNFKRREDGDFVLEDFNDDFYVA
jgi:phage gp46-like protein